MTEALSGTYLEPASLLGDMVANSATFQTLTGSEDATEAASHVLYVYDELATATRPFCFIEVEDSTGTGQDPTRNVQHTILMAMEFTTPEGYGTRDAVVYARKKASLIINEMRANQDQLMLHEIQKLLNGERSTRAERAKGEDYVKISFQITAGI